MQDLDHKHLIVTAALRTPPTTTEVVENWLERLVTAVDMKILFGPQVVKCDTLGNEGVTGLVCIETSHAAIHVWETASVPYVKFDLYSCKRFDPTVVTRMMHEFDPYYITSMLLDRNSGIQVVCVHDEQVVSIADMLPDDLKPVYEYQGNYDSKLVRKVRDTYDQLASKFSIKALRNQKKNTTNYTLKNVKTEAAQRDLDYDLTDEWFGEALKLAKAKWPKINTHPSDDSFWRAEIDRINSSEGYMQQNCRLIPRALHVAKWKWNNQEMGELIDLLKDDFNTDK